MNGHIPRIDLQLLMARERIFNELLTERLKSFHAEVLKDFHHVIHNDNGSIRASAGSPAPSIVLHALQNYVPDDAPSGFSPVEFPRQPQSINQPTSMMLNPTDLKLGNGSVAEDASSVANSHFQLHFENSPRGPASGRLKSYFLPERPVTAIDLEKFRKREVTLYEAATAHITAETVDNSAQPRLHPATRYDDEEAAYMVNLMRTPTGRWAFLMIDVLDGGMSADQEIYLEICKPWNEMQSEVAQDQAVMMPSWTDIEALNAAHHLKCEARIHPNNPARVAWLTVGTVFVLYDLFVVPVRLSGITSTVQNQALDVIARPTILYWIGDLILNFFVSYHSAGQLVTDMKRVAMNYIKHWFFVDLVVVLSDVIVFILYMSSPDSGDPAVPGGNPLAVTRTLRILRIARILRIGKLVASLGDLLQDSRSESLLLVMQLVQHLMSIFIVNHYIACAWYATGMIDYEQSWIKKIGLEDYDWHEGYFYALHWSLTQFTPATNNIAPGNWRERLFSVIVVIFALVSFSSFVSGVTNAVNQLRRLNQDMIDEAERIRKFLIAHDVSQDLGSRILHFFTTNFSRTRKIQEADIRFFRVLPESLLVDLHFESNAPILKSHSLFERLWEFDEVTLQKICHESFGEESYLPRQEVFKFGKESHKAVYLVRGTFYYQSQHHSGELFENIYLAEMTLWVKWQHMGLLTAVAQCQVATINALSFQNIFAKHGGPMFSRIKRYVAFVVGYQERSSDRLTDLPIEEGEMKNIVARVMRMDRSAKTFTENGFARGVT